MNSREEREFDEAMKIAPEPEWPPEWWLALVARCTGSGEEGARE